MVVIMKTAKEQITDVALQNIKYIIDLCTEIGEGLRSENENEIKVSAALAKVVVDFMIEDASKLALEMVTHREYQH
jgi:hypothetical protein